MSEVPPVLPYATVPARPRKFPVRFVVGVIALYLVLEGWLLFDAWRHEADPDYATLLIFVSYVPLASIATLMLWIFRRR